MVVLAAALPLKESSFIRENVPPDAILFAQRVGKRAISTPTSLES
jgi:hypothetical protein